MTTAELMEQVKNGKLIKHHTSRTRNYVSRKGNGIVNEYDGQFGKGYKHLTPAFDSSQYCWITYYVEA